MIKRDLFKSRRFLDKRQDSFIKRCALITEKPDKLWEVDSGTQTRGDRLWDSGWQTMEMHSGNWMLAFGSTCGVNKGFLVNEKSPLLRKTPSKLEASFIKRGFFIKGRDLL